MAPTTIIALMGDVHASSLGSGDAIGVGSTPRTAPQEGRSSSETKSRCWDQKFAQSGCGKPEDEQSCSCLQCFVQTWL